MAFMGLGQGTREVASAESELTRVWRFGLSCFLLALLALTLVLLETALLGGGWAVLLGLLGGALIAFVRDDPEAVAFGVAALCVGVLLAVLRAGGYWWAFEFRAQGGALYLLTDTASRALPGWLHLVRVLVALTLPPAFYVPARVVYARFVREAALPMLSNAQPGKGITIDGMKIPGVGWVSEKPGDAPPAPQKRTVTLSVPHPALDPEPQQVGDVDGEPAVSIGGRRNGNGHAISELPLALFGRDGEAEAEAWTRLQVFTDAALSGAPLSRPYWTHERALFTDPQYRAIIDWMKDAGLAAKTGKARTDGYQLTRGGKAALTYIQTYLSEYRASA